MKANYSDAVAYRIYDTLYKIFGERQGQKVKFEIQRRDGKKMELNEKSA